MFSLGNISKIYYRNKYFFMMKFILFIYNQMIIDLARRMDLKRRILLTNFNNNKK